MKFLLKFLIKIPIIKIFSIEKKKKRTMKKFCRICHEEDEEGDEHNKVNNLFSPCLCKGTTKYVHKNCLEKWRKQNKKKRKYNAYLCCEICGNFN